MKSLQNISYKTLFTILFFSVAGIIFFIRIGKPAQKVSAAWWDELWHYRKAISLSNSNTDITNQYVKITLDTASLISANKMKNTCDDIRVTNINGKTLTHFIDGNTAYDCNENDTSIYVLVDSIPSSGGTIFLYYGNPSATNVEPQLGTQENPAISCKNILEHRNDNQGNKYYYISPSGNISDTIQTECNMTDDAGGWTKVYDGLCTSATSINRTTGNILEISSPKLTFNQMRINAKNWVYSDIKTTTETAVMQLTFSGYYQWLHSQPNTPNPDIKFHSAQDGLQDVMFTTTAVMMMGYGNEWRRILPHFYTVPHDSYMYLGSLGSVGINRLEWSGSDYNQTMNNIYPIESGKGLTPRSFQEIEVWVRENEITLLTNQSVDSIATEELSPAPIAYWKFDEGASNIIQDSTGNFNGSFSGTTFPTWQSEDQCISGKCLYSTGNGSVLIGNPSNFRIINNSITIETWVKFNSLDYTNNTGKLIGFAGKGSPDTAPGIASSGFWFSYDNRNNGKSFNYTCFGNSAGGYAGGNNNFSGYNYTFNNNTWYHLAITISQNQGRLYINGQQIGSAKTFSGLQLDNTLNNLYISSLNGSYNLPGYIDEFKIYPYARTADQIKQDYNSRGSMSGSSVNLGVQSNTTPSLKSSLVAHYKFDEGEGTTAYNSGVGGSAFNSIFGTGNSAPIWTNNGKTNKALSFDGVKSYLRTPPLSGISQASWSVWVKPNTTSSMHVIKSNAGSDYLIANINSKAFRVRTFTGSGDIHTTSGVLPTDKWSQLTMVYYNPGIKLYLNGKLENQNVGYSMGNLSSTYNIGLFGGAEPVFNGLIDEVKIYNRALTDEEVKQDYNAGSAIQFGSTSQSIGGTTTSLEYCIPGDTSFCASPVAEWNFEENTGSTAKDTSGNNLNGSLAGNPTWGSQCHKGSCLTLDHIDNRMTVNHSSFLEPTSITIGGWVKLNNINDRHVLFTKWNGYSIEINSSGYPYFRTYNGSQQDLNSNKNIVWGKWHYISATFDDTTKQKNIYLDGINVGTTTVTNSIAYSQGVFAIPYSSGLMASGLVDDVRIYNYARTPAQIAYDYNRGAPIGWWKLDECQGSTAFDSSGIGNTGVISIGQSGTQTTLGTCQTGTSAAWTNGASGKINSSLKLDGQDDYITSPITVNGSNATIAFWVKNPTSGIGPYLLRSNAGVRTYITISGNTIGFMKGSPTAVGITGKTINPSEWNHVVLKWWTDNNGISYGQSYINGQALGTGSSFTDTTNGSYITLGGYTTTGTQNASGQFDDVRVYNYTLTSEQIKQVYNGGSVNFK